MSSSVSVNDLKKMYSIYKKKKKKRTIELIDSIPDPLLESFNEDDLIGSDFNYIKSLVPDLEITE